MPLRLKAFPPNAPEPPGEGALRCLLEAYERAGELGREPWDFAVELAALLAHGLTVTDLRGLICHGDVEHAVEVTRPEDTRRVFHRTENLAVKEGSCFVLTPAGVARLRGGQPGSAAVLCPNGTRATEPAEHARPAAPHWDDATHTLYWGEIVVKHFKREAECQEAVLRAFQARHWIPVIEVTCIQDFGIDDKHQAHETIKNLNRSVGPYLRFRQEGNGTRIRWEPREAARSTG
jgi:hypothetical protein